MIDLKLSKKRMQMHLHYYSWRYVVLLVVALFAANMLFTVTRPDTPADKRVDIIIIPSQSTGDNTDAWSNAILRTLPADQLEVNVTMTPIIQGNESTIYQLIAARLSAGEGNIWVMPRDMFLSYAQTGAWQSLDGMLDKFNLPKGADISTCRVAVQPDENTAAEEHVCGIPLDQCLGLAELIIPTDMVLAIPSFATVNIDNAIASANWMLSRTDAPVLTPSFSSTAKLELPILAGSFKTANADAWQEELMKSLGSEELIVSVPLEALREGRESFAAGLIASGIKSGSGAAYIVPKAVFTELAGAGVLRALDDDIASFNVPEGTDLALGKAAAVKDGKAGETRQYGIPLDQCASLARVTAPEGMLLVFPSWRNTDFSYDTAKAAANWLLTTELEPYKAPPAVTAKPSASAGPTATAQ